MSLPVLGRGSFFAHQMNLRLAVMPAIDNLFRGLALKSQQHEQSMDVGLNPSPFRPRTSR